MKKSRGSQRVAGILVCGVLLATTGCEDGGSDDSPLTLAQVAAKVVAGQGVNKTSEYLGAGPHKFYPYGSYDLSSDDGWPGGWVAETVPEVQLIAHFVEQHNNTGRKWTASGGTVYNLYTTELTVTLYQAFTAAVVASKTWIEDDSPFVARVSGGNAYPLSATSEAKVEEWLRPYIERPTP
jgi:hypothetical protein